jgi:hypothetical protein
MMLSRSNHVIPLKSPGTWSPGTLKAAANPAFRRYFETTDAAAVYRVTDPGLAPRRPLRPRKMQKNGLHWVTALRGNLTHLIFVRPHPSNLIRARLSYHRFQAVALSAVDTGCE